MHNFANRAPELKIPKVPKQATFKQLGLEINIEIGFFKLYKSELYF